MPSDKKNKGTLLSSTLKIKEKKAHLFLWSDENLLSYGHFVVFSRWRTFDHKSQNDKMAVSHSNDAK